MRSEASIYQGNSETDGQPYRGWFVGPFIDSSHPMVRTGGVEVKWARHNSGAHRNSKGSDRTITTLALLASGEIEFRFDDRIFRLRNAGDYLLWSPDLPHLTSAIKESSLITVRWPYYIQEQAG